MAKGKLTGGTVSKMKSTRGKSRQSPSPEVKIKPSLYVDSRDIGTIRAEVGGKLNLRIQGELVRKTTEKGKGEAKRESYTIDINKIGVSKKKGK